MLGSGAVMTTSLLAARSAPPTSPDPTTSALLYLPTFAVVTDIAASVLDVVSSANATVYSIRCRPGSQHRKSAYCDNLGFTVSQGNGTVAYSYTDKGYSGTTSVQTYQVFCTLTAPPCGYFSASSRDGVYYVTISEDSNIPMPSASSDLTPVLVTGTIGSSNTSKGIPITTISTWDVLPPITDSPNSTTTHSVTPPTTTSSGGIPRVTRNLALLGGFVAMLSVAMIA